MRVSKNGKSNVNAKERKENEKPVQHGKYADDFSVMNKRKINDAIYQMKRALRKNYYAHEVEWNIGEFDRM